MDFLDLNLFRHPSGVAFDPAKVIEKARAAFADAIFKPGDQLAAEARRVEVWLADELKADPASPASQVLRSLRRKARSYGPAYAFIIPLKNGEEIKGLARSVNVQFLFPENLPHETRQPLIEFLKSLGIGFLEASTHDARQSEILCDLSGPSDCLSDLPEVPWKIRLYSAPVLQPEAV